MYEFIVGCDISKETFDVSYHSKDESVYLGQYDNRETGFKKLIKRIVKLTQADKSTWLIVFENTGIYSKEIKYYFIKNGIPCVEENPL